MKLYASYLNIIKESYTITTNSKQILMDNQISEYLDIPFKEYINILKKCNGKFTHPSAIYFETKEDCEKAIEVLTPHLIMANLLGENNG